MKTSTLIAVGLGAWLLFGSKAKAAKGGKRRKLSPAEVEARKRRIVQESDEIIDGERDEYSPA